MKQRVQQLHRRRHTIPEQINPSNAIDLAEVKARADERDNAEAIEAQRQFVAEAQAWDRAMRRTFKGIFPAWKRRIFLKQRLREIEKERALAE